MSSAAHPMGLVVVSPLGRPDLVAWAYAPRPATLAGKRLALVDNSKHNTDVILRELAAILDRRFGLAETRLWRKVSPARGVAPEQLAEMHAAGIDAAVAGIGD